MLVQNVKLEANKLDIF